MRIFRTISIFLITLALVLPLAAAQATTTTPAPDTGLHLYRELPRDPLAVLAIYLDDPANELDGLVKLLDRFAGPAGVDTSDAGRRLEELMTPDLLQSIGPDVTLSIDLPPLDEAVAALQETDAATLRTLFGKSGILAQARDESALDRALRDLAGRLGAAVEERNGLIAVDLPLAGAAGPEAWSLYYKVQDGRMALGFSEEWVRSTLDGPAEGQRLTDGRDFANVFANLDPYPTDLTYINLPKLYAYVTESQVVQVVLQSNPDAREFVERLFSPETMGVGLGSTTVRVRKGVRMTNFGPPWMSGAAMSSGLLTALAVPNLMVAADRGKADRTVTDIESIARACEGFSTDSQGYPGPTRGWVPVENIAAFLEPVYIHQLPRTDAWQNPLLYWSNGGSYRILSMGQDGRMDRDWSDPQAPLVGTSFGDIVYGDGRLLTAPGASSD